MLGALDVDVFENRIAAILPDSVATATVSGAFGASTVTVSPAVARDDGSIWILTPRPVRAGRTLIVPAQVPAPPEALRLSDGPAFGTGLHPTTVLCLEALDEALEAVAAARVLDVGTGSGVLALSVLMQGVPWAVGLDIDPDALRVAAHNARINDLAGRLHLVRGGPEAVTGAWPLIVANLQAAPLIEMAPALVRRVGHGGRLILSGIPWSLASEVERTYVRLGMRQLRVETRSGWSVLVLVPSW